MSFFGFAVYFNKFNIGFADLVHSLPRISKESVRCDWSAECQKSLRGVKHVLCDAPVLALPDPSKRFAVVCNACKEGIGAVLLQEGRPIAVEGKALTDAEARYHIGEQELQGRWAEKLPKYRFTWEYRPGRSNIADPLSILPMSIAQVVCFGLGVAVTADAQNAKCNGVAEIMAGYAFDKYFADEKLAAALTLKDGLYYKGNAVVVPNVWSIKVQKGLHDATYAGHTGIHRTVKNVQRSYWWPAMSEEIADCVGGCKVCQGIKSSKRQSAGKPCLKELGRLCILIASLTCLRRSRDRLRSGL